MEDIRIGNDIKVLWRIVTGDGEQPYGLEGKKLSLYMRHPFGKIEITDFSVKGNALEFMFWGKDQKYTGCYAFTLVENDGLEDMHTVDACDAFSLVSCSCKAGGDADSKVELVHLELKGTMVLGGTSVQVDKELSPDSENAIANNAVYREFDAVKRSVKDILTIAPLSGNGVIATAFKQYALAEKVGTPISCLVKKDDFEEHYRQMTLVSTKVGESQYRMDFSEIGAAPYAGGIGESGIAIAQELLWAPGTTILVKKTISYLYDLSSDYVFPLGESNIPDTFFINLKGLITNYYVGDRCFPPTILEKFFGMSMLELRSMITNPLVTVVVCYPTQENSPLEVGRTIPLTKRVVEGDTILLEFDGREFFITISLDSENLMWYSIESRTFMTEEKANETFVKKSKLEELEEAIKALQTNVASLQNNS